MSLQVDYTTIALVASASGFFSAFGMECAKALIESIRQQRMKNVKDKDAV
jgi:hypothetical protein